MTSSTRFTLGSLYLLASFACVLAIVSYATGKANALVAEEQDLLRLLAKWYRLETQTMLLLHAPEEPPWAHHEWDLASRDFAESLDRNVRSPLLAPLGDRVRSNLAAIEFAWLQPRRALESIRYAHARASGERIPGAPRDGSAESFYRAELVRQGTRFGTLDEAFLQTITRSVAAINSEIESRRSRNFRFALGLSLLFVGIGIVLNWTSWQDSRRLNRELELRVAERTAEIQERRRAEEALGRSEEKYRTILQGIEEGYVEVGLDGRLVFSSDPLCRMSGYSAEELARLPFTACFPRASRVRLLRGVREVRRYGETLVECTGRRKDGALVALEISLSAIKTPTGEPARVRGVVRNVTERRRAEEDRQRLELQLAQAQRLESLGTLAGGIAHDFNNLLTGIAGNATMLQVEKPASERTRQRLQNIIELVHSGAALTRQLLGFARAGRYEPKATDLAEIVRKVAAMFCRTRKEIRLHEDYAGDRWPVEVDRGQLEQVLLNLLVNASDAMPRGGDLYLSVENAPLDLDTADADGVRSERFVKLVVRDTGMGMNEATRQRVFEPFFTTKGKGRGSGLGLASVYGIVKAHGGLVEVRSEPGKGSTFEVCLPASTRPPEPERTVRSEEAWSRGRETVLLVDDEEVVRLTCADMLRHLGYEVLVAASGEEALALYRTEGPRISLAIVDMIMPGMGGDATLAELRRIDPEVRVLLASGYSIERQASRALAQGSNGFLQKPFTMAELASKVREILQRT